MQPGSSPNGALDMPSRTTWYILTPTLVVSGLLLAAGLSGAWYVHRVNRDVSYSLDEVLAATQSAERLVLAIRDVREELHRFINDGEVSHLDDAEASVAAIEVELGLGEILADHLSLDRLHAFRQQFQLLRDREPARDAVFAMLVLLNDELLAPAERVLKNRQQLATDASRQNQALADRIGMGLLLLSVSGAVAGVLFGFGIARSVHRSLVEITVPVRDIAGRLDEVVGPIKVASNTDLAELDDMLRVLADKTSDVVRRLQESQQETLRSEQLAAIGQLAAGLAHELRNPLMSVKLIVQTARERADESLNGRDLAVIEDEVTRLEKMLQMFLDFARPPQPEKQVLDIRKVVEDATEFIRPRADQQGVRLQYSVPSHELPVDADESQVRQVLLNLLINALDALPSGGSVWVDVGQVVDLPAGRNANPPYEVVNDMAAENGQMHSLPYAIVRITDDGPGVSPNVIERVFEPFVSTKVTGIGLGLSISRRIVESHNGHITVRNREEGGADFTIYLPSNSLAAREHFHANIACH